MIKKLQALRAKKGFTLVELIVVIAIIGVLAAILVPTLLGVVTKSRVTSADSTASSIKTQIDTFLTDADAAGYGMKAVATNITTITAEVTGAGAWTVTVGDPGMFKSRATSTGDVAWGPTGSATAGAAIAAGADPTTMLAQSLADTFPDMTRVIIYAQLVGGQNCTFVAYTADSSTIADLTGEITASALVDASTGIPNKTSNWDGKTAGIGKSTGYTIGTSPKVNKD